MISDSGHYRTAESILGEVGTVPRGRPELAIAMAQVYATLAIADAIAATIPDPIPEPVPEQQPTPLNLAEPYFSAGRALPRRHD